MLLIAVLVAIAFLAAAACWWRSRPPPAVQVPARATRAAQRFAAVEIRRRSGACAAAHALDGERFLANQAPALPLSGCTKARCDCTFAKLSDRRADERRWGDHEGLSAAMFNQTERRTKSGRRDAD